MSEFRLPPLQGVAEWSGGGEPTEAEVAELLVDDGVLVEQGQQVLEVALDKVNMMVETPAAGTIRWQVQVGDIVAPGDLLGRIE
jgi:pyruvate/2-oxoglutarate dehydrogenase complex dihydrolipoamide acyltransferase (E2) component